ncbi:hypothetical protein [Streptomyces sp. NPDC048157]|uniref:hypothetical protein n=1 Tax=Streptomyces sp. NPDC048157 TaxID=3365503 RepID=UPI0037128C0B
MLPVYPYHLPYVPDLTTQQLDGQECVYCPPGVAPDDPMRPVSRLRGVLLFAHTDCANENRMEEVA